VEPRQDSQRDEGVREVESVVDVLYEADHVVLVRLVVEASNPEGIWRARVGERGEENDTSERSEQQDGDGTPQQAAALPAIDTYCGEPPWTIG
jgi:hypothetical protein